MPFLSPEFWKAAISLAYFAIAAIMVLIVVVVVWKAQPKSRWAWLAVPVTIVLAMLPPGYLHYQKWKADKEWAEKQAAQIAHFEMRCKSAGEKIYQTVKGVDGIFIMKPRVVPDTSHYQDQFGLWDPYGTDKGEARNPAIFLFPNANYAKESGGIEITGFQFVETLHASPNENFMKFKRLIRTGPIDPNDSLDALFKNNVSQELDNNLKSRYGITWDDLSTMEDREKWIAGGRLRVIELATQKVIAERIGYMREPGVGQKQYDRLTWLFAAQYACPPFVADVIKDRHFLAKVFPK